MNTMNHTPIVLANTEWMPPEKLLNEARAERMIRGLCDLIKPKLSDNEVGDAEALAYLMPQTEKAPLPTRWSEVYLYLVGQVLKRWKQYETLPEDCRVEKLDDYSMGKLKELKKRIYKSRGGKFRNPVLSAIKEVFIK